MDGAQFKAIRKGLKHNGRKLTVLQWARALGYSGTVKTVREQVSRYERDLRPIPPWIARLALMYQTHGIPPQFLEEDQEAREQGG